MRARACLACLALAVVAGCGNDDTNDPPQIAISSPGDGDHLTAAANVVAEVSDDEGIVKVRFTLDGELLLEDTVSPWQAAIPVGTAANGLPVVLGATAWDTDGVETQAADVTITIDPALQTVPQLLAFGPTAADEPVLAARWLRFPAATAYTLQFSRSAGFGAVFFEQTLPDTEYTSAVPDTGIVYARVRARVAGEFLGWSRSRRFAAVDPLLTTVPLSGSQAGLSAVAQPEGFLVVSGPRDDVEIGTVAPEALTLAADGSVLARSALPAFTAQWTAAPAVYLCGADWVARHALAGGGEVWRSSLAGLIPGAVGGDGTTVLVAGPSTSEAAAPLVIVQVAADDGAELGRVAVPTEAGDVVTEVHGLADLWVVAGEIAAGGVWVRAVDPDGGEVAWRLHLGTSDGFRLRGAAVGGDGLVLVGEADSGGAWAAGVAAGGRLRWLAREADWIGLTGVAVSFDGDLLVSGDALGDRGQPELAYGALTSAGAWRWQQRRAFGVGARCLGIAPADDGTIVVTGTALLAGGDWDLLLLRADDHGDLD
jgi:hypothetical protein